MAIVLLCISGVYMIILVILAVINAVRASQCTETGLLYEQVEAGKKGGAISASASPEERHVSTSLYLHTSWLFCSVQAKMPCFVHSQSDLLVRATCRPRRNSSMSLSTA